MHTTPMMREVDVSSDLDEPPDLRRQIEHVVERVASHTGRASWNVSVLLCSDQRIASLNEEFREQTGSTDVLSFGPENQDPQTIEGDIAVSLESVRRNAMEWGVSYKEELLRVLVHALLHLQGQEHSGVTMNSPEAIEHPMFTMQESLVKTLADEAEEWSV